MRIRGLIFCLFFAVTLTSLSCHSGSPERDVVSTVNDAPILTEELQKEVARYSNLNPAQKITSNTVEDCLENIIEQKLMVQEAVKMKLHQDREFIEAIKNYWEQSLIRSLVDAKIKEFSGKIFVTDAEIREEYARMCLVPRIRAARAKTKQAADDIVKAMQAGKPPIGVETIGPIRYENLKGSPLANAFDMKTGEVKAFVLEDECIVLQVLTKGRVPMPPMESIYAHIRESLLQQKKQLAVKTWMESVKKSAKLIINDKKYSARRVAHE